MVIRLILVGLLLAFSGGARAATYVMQCSPGACQAPDGTTQAAGVFIRAFQWDGITPYTPPDGTVIVPFTGQTIYAPPVNATAQNLVAANSAFSTGFALASTGNPALNGVYAVTSDFMIDAALERLCIAATGTTNLASDGKFCNGVATRQIPDTTGALHTFDVSHFDQFLLALAKYRDALYEAQLQLSNGVNATPPTAAATIP